MKCSVIPWECTSDPGIYQSLRIFCESTDCSQTPLQYLADGKNDWSRSLEKAIFPWKSVFSVVLTIPLGISVQQLLWSRNDALFLSHGLVLGKIWYLGVKKFCYFSQTHCIPLLCWFCGQLLSIPVKKVEGTTSKKSSEKCSLTSIL